MVSDSIFARWRGFAGAAGVWAWPLAATLLMQTVTAFQTRIFPLLGPSLTNSAAIPSAYIGYLVALHSVGTAWFLLSGGDLLPRFGPLRTMQLGVVFGLAGLLLALFGTWWPLVISALVIGFGYGPSATAGTEVLMRFAPARHRSLVFSIKQSGVPLGGALAGATLPALIELAGWRGACLVSGLVMLALTFLVQPLRTQVDGQREAKGLPLLPLVDPRVIGRPFAALKGDADLQLFTVAGLCFACAQGILFGFFVAYAMEQGRLTLAAAGLAFSSMQLAGIIGRLVAGWLSDHLRMPRLVLAGLGAGSALALVLMSRLDASWSSLQVHVVAAMAGGTSTSWNGVFMSEVGRMSAPGKIGETTAATTFFLFLGYVAGPALFGWAIVGGLPYHVAFLLLTGVVAIGAAAFAATMFRSRLSG